MDCPHTVVNKGYFYVEKIPRALMFTILLKSIINKALFLFLLLHGAGGSLPDYTCNCHTPVRQRGSTAHAVHSSRLAHVRCTL